MSTLGSGTFGSGTFGDPGGGGPAPPVELEATLDGSGSAEVEPPALGQPGPYAATADGSGEVVADLTTVPTSVRGRVVVKDTTAKTYPATFGRDKVDRDLGGVTHLSADGYFEQPPSAGLVYVNFNADVQGSGEVEAGPLNSATAVSVTADGAGTVEADVTRLVPLAVAVDGSGTVAATTALLRALDASLDGSGTTQAALVSQVGLEAEVDGFAEVLATLASPISLALIADGSADLTAVLSARVLITLEAALEGAGSSQVAMSVVKAPLPLRAGPRARSRAAWV